MFSKAPLDGPDFRLSRYDHLIVHCTATPPNVDADAAWVDKAHHNRGFANGNGYHAVITRVGDWQDHDGGFLTRPVGNEGAHVGDCGAGWNGRAFGVSLSGGVDSNGHPQMNFGEAQMFTLEQGILKFLDLHPNPDSVIIFGHRDLIAQCKAPPKACPCFDFDDWWINLGHLSRVRARANSPVTSLSSMHIEDTPNPNSLMLHPVTYTVKAGDTLSALSLLYGISVAKIEALNELKTDTIYVGQKLIFK